MPENLLDEGNGSDQPTGLADCWLLHFPSQCVLIAEAIIWQRCVVHLVEKANKNDLKIQWLDISLITYLVLKSFSNS